VDHVLPQHCVECTTTAQSVFVHLGTLEIHSVVADPKKLKLSHHPILVNHPHVDHFLPAKLLMNNQLVLVYLGISDLHLLADRNAS